MFSKYCHSRLILKALIEKSYQLEVGICKTRNSNCSQHTDFQYITFYSRSFTRVCFYKQRGRKAFLSKEREGKGQQPWNFEINKKNKSEFKPSLN